MKRNVEHFYIIHVNLSSDCQCSKNLGMNVAIARAHRECERNVCKDQVGLIEGKALYRSVIFKLPILFCAEYA